MDAEIEQLEAERNGLMRDLIMDVLPGTHNPVLPVRQAIDEYAGRLTAARVALAKKIGVELEDLDRATMKHSELMRLWEGTQYVPHKLKLLQRLTSVLDRHRALLAQTGREQPELTAELPRDPELFDLDSATADVALVALRISDLHTELSRLGAELKIPYSSALRPDSPRVEALRAEAEGDRSLLAAELHVESSWLADIDLASIVDIPAAMYGLWEVWAKRLADIRRRVRFAELIDERHHAERVLDIEAARLAMIWHLTEVLVKAMLFDVRPRQVSDHVMYAETRAGPDVLIVFTTSPTAFPRSADPYPALRELVGRTPEFAGALASQPAYRIVHAHVWVTEEGHLGHPCGVNLAGVADVEPHYREPNDQQIDPGANIVALQSDTVSEQVELEAASQVQPSDAIDIESGAGDFELADYADDELATDGLVALHRWTGTWVAEFGSSGDLPREQLAALILSLQYPDSAELRSQVRYIDWRMHVELRATLVGLWTARDSTTPSHAVGDRLTTLHMESALAAGSRAGDRLAVARMDERPDQVWLAMQAINNLYGRPVIDIPATDRPWRPGRTEEEIEEVLGRQERCDSFDDARALLDGMPLGGRMLVRIGDVVTVWTKSQGRPIVEIDPAAGYAELLDEVAEPAIGPGRRGRRVSVSLFDENAELQVTTTDAVADKQTMQGPIAPDASTPVVRAHEKHWSRYAKFNWLGLGALPSGDWYLDLRKANGIAAAMDAPFTAAAVRDAELVIAIERYRGRDDPSRDELGAMVEAQHEHAVLKECIGWLAGERLALLGLAAKVAGLTRTKNDPARQLALSEAVRRYEIAMLRVAAWRSEGRARAALSRLVGTLLPAIDPAGVELSAELLESLEERRRIVQRMLVGEAGHELPFEDNPHLKDAFDSRYRLGVAIYTVTAHRRLSAIAEQLAQLNSSLQALEESHPRHQDAANDVADEAWRTLNDTTSAMIDGARVYRAEIAALDHALDALSAARAAGAVAVDCVPGIVDSVARTRAIAGLSAARRGLGEGPSTALENALSAVRAGPSRVEFTLTAIELDHLLSEASRKLAAAAWQVDVPAELTNIVVLLTDYGRGVASAERVRLIVTRTATESGRLIDGVLEGVREIRTGTGSSRKPGAELFGRFDWRDSNDGTSPSWSLRLWGDRKRIGRLASALVAQLAGLVPDLDANQVNAVAAEAVRRASRRRAGVRRSGTLAVDVRGGQLHVRAWRGIVRAAGGPCVFDASIAPGTAGAGAAASQHAAASAAPPMEIRSREPEASDAEVDRAEDGIQRINGRLSAGGGFLIEHTDNGLRLYEDATFAFRADNRLVLALAGDISGERVRVLIRSGHLTPEGPSSAPLEDDSSRTYDMSVELFGVSGSRSGGARSVEERKLLDDAARRPLGEQLAAAGFSVVADDVVRLHHNDIEVFARIRADNSIRFYRPVGDGDHVALIARSRIIGIESLAPSWEAGDIPGLRLTDGRIEYTLSSVNPSPFRSRPVPTAEAGGEGRDDELPPASDRELAGSPPDSERDGSPQTEDATTVAYQPRAPLVDRSAEDEPEKVAADSPAPGPAGGVGQMTALEYIDLQLGNLDAVSRRLLEQNSVVVGRTAVRVVLGEPATTEPIELSVPEWIYRNLQKSPDWVPMPIEGGEIVEQSVEGHPSSRWPRRTERFPVLARGRLRLSVGRHDLVSHEDLDRRGTTIGGSRVAGLPDELTVGQGRDLAVDRRTVEWIRDAMLSPTRPPLSDEALANQIDEIVAMLRTELPDEVVDEAIADPEIWSLIGLIAEGWYVARTLYGDPDIGRANQYWGSFELPEFLVMAFYHDGDILGGLKSLLVNGIQQGLGLRTILLAMGGAAWSDDVYGYGRASDNPDNPVGHDEARSAELLFERARLRDIPEQVAAAMAAAVDATAFNQRLRTQIGRLTDELRAKWNLDDTHAALADQLARMLCAEDLQGLSEKDALVRSFMIMLEDEASLRAGPRRLFGRAQSRLGVRIHDAEQAFRWAWTYRHFSPGGTGVTLGQALVGRLRGSAAFFIDPDHGYQPPDGRILGKLDWIRGNRAMRRDHAAELTRIAGILESVLRLEDELMRGDLDPQVRRDLQDELRRHIAEFGDGDADPNETLLSAFRQAERHAERMGDKYRDFQWEQVVRPGEQPWNLADIAASLTDPRGNPLGPDIIAAVTAVTELAQPAAGKAVVVFTLSDGTGDHPRLRARLDYTLRDGAEAVTAEQVRARVPDIACDISTDTTVRPEMPAWHHVLLDFDDEVAGRNVPEAPPPDGRSQEVNAGSDDPGAGSAAEQLDGSALGFAPLPEGWVVVGEPRVFEPSVVPAEGARAADRAVVERQQRRAEILVSLLGEVREWRQTPPDSEPLALGQVRDRALEGIEISLTLRLEELRRDLVNALGINAVSMRYEDVAVVATMMANLERLQRRMGEVRAVFVDLVRLDALSESTIERFAKQLEDLEVPPEDLADDQPLHVSLALYEGCPDLHSSRRPPALTDGSCFCTGCTDIGTINRPVGIG